MTTPTLSTLRRCLLVAALAALVLTTTSATAGGGDFFKLGQTNTADATSVLTGTTAGPQLNVINKNGDYAGIKAESAGGFAAAVYGLHSSDAGAGAGVQGISASTQPLAFAVYGLLLSTTPGSGSAAIRGQVNSGGGNGVGVYGSHAGSGTAVVGQSHSGYGVVGQGGFRGGYFSSSLGTGVEATATAANESAVRAHHDGSNFGYGLFAQSAVGPAIGMNGPDTGQPPITLNGKPFPSATGGYKDGSVSVPNDGAYHRIASLNVGPGTYAIIAKANVATAASAGFSRAGCRLGADGDYDETWSDPSGVDLESASFALFHSFASAGAVTLSCLASTSGQSVDIRGTKILAIRVAGGTNTPMP